VLMVMGYVDNIPEGITGTNYFAPTYLTNETEFQVYINFIKEVTKRTRKFDNIAYVFCTEIFDISLKYGLSYPTNIESFRNYCRTKNPDLNYWNGRWKTNHKDWDTVFPIDPDYHNTEERWRDHWNWISWIIRNRLPSIVNTIREVNPRAQLGYHDHTLINLNWGDSPIPSPNPFNFLSFNCYPESSHIKSEIVKVEKKLERFRDLYPSIPLILGETGMSTAEYSLWEQASWLYEIVKWTRSKGLGFNIWMWRDYYPEEHSIVTPPREQHFGLLTRDGVPKPALASVQSALDLVSTKIKLNNMEVTPEDTFYTKNFTLDLRVEVASNISEILMAKVTWRNREDGSVLWERNLNRTALDTYEGIMTLPQGRYRLEVYFVLSNNMTFAVLTLDIIGQENLFWQLPMGGIALIATLAILICIVFFLKERFRKHAPIIQEKPARFAR